MKNEIFFVRRIEQATAIGKDVEAAFGTWAEDELNRKPGPKRWSVGECLDHLIVTNRTYYPTFDALIGGSRKPGLWEKLSPFSAYFGRLLLESTGAVVKKKYQSPPAFRSPRSTVPASIVKDFLAEQECLADYLRNMRHLDASRIIVSSPASPLVTYSLEACLEIILAHEERHVRQAKAVAGEGAQPAP